MRLQGDFSKRLLQNIGQFRKNFGHYFEKIGHFRKNIGYFRRNIGHKIYNLRLARLVSFVCFVETPIRDKEILFFALK